MPGIVTNLPGGQQRTLSGGTRNEVKLSRPWQASLSAIIDPENCPFCNKPQEDLVLPSNSPKGWRWLPNIFTPHPEHTLLIPDRCWLEEELQEWGGEKKICEAIQIASRVFRRHRKEMIALAHVEHQSGQNLGHAHLHFFEVQVTNPLSARSLEMKDLMVLGQDGITAIAGGVKAGECLLFSEHEAPFSLQTAETVGQVLHRLIAVGNKAWKSTQGLAPSYSFAVRVSADGLFRYGCYSPNLSNWGVYNHTVTALEGEPYVLPWPHETTVDHLRRFV